MLHPVGDLPASVYWRRRLVVLVVLLALLGGAGWLVAILARGADAGADDRAASTSGRVPIPGLERVVPSLAGVRTPDHGSASPAPDERPTLEVPATPATPTPGSRCTDEAIELVVQAPGEVPAGSKPTLEVVVRNVGTVPCVRRVDQELLEILLLGSDGARVWGSNDCFPEQSDRAVTLRPRSSVTLSLVWGGLTSAPGCTGERVVPPAGDYVLRARLDTDTSADRPIRIR